MLRHACVVLCASLGLAAALPARAVVHSSTQPAGIAAPAYDLGPAKETAATWDRWHAAQPGTWSITWNPATGYAGTISASGAATRSGAPATVSAAVLSDLQDVTGVAPASLVLDDVTLAGEVYHLRYHQMSGGLPVEGAEVRVHLTRSGQLVMLTSSAAPGAIDLGTTPSLSPAAAIARVLGDIGMMRSASRPAARLVVLPGSQVPGDDPLTYRLAYVVDVRVQDPAASWHYLVDATSGELLTRSDVNRYTSGTVTGNVFPNVGSDALVTRAMGWENVTVGTSTATTDASGNYSTTATGNISSKLSGPYVNVVNEDVASASYSSSGSGGADYTVASTTYSWVTATTTTGITTDDQAKAFTLGFTFPFYGTNYTSVNVCSNGFLNFGTSSTAYSPAAIPTAATPNALIAPLWRDLAPNLGGTIYYSSSATQFVILFSAVRNYSTTGTQTFEVILKPDGTITYQYQSVTNDVTTVQGVENQAGSAGRTNATPANLTAVKFTPTSGGSAVSTWTWAYATTDTHVDEVNGCYHIGLIHDYYKTVQGFTGMDYSIKATVHTGTNYANAYYSPTDKNIYFGDGDGVNVLDTAKSRDVWYHEYTHGVVDHIYNLGQTGEAGAMSEGMADYFACTYTGDHLLGEWVFPSPVYQRDLQNTLKTPQDLTGEIHDDGRIYSGSVWDLRTAVGTAVADKLAFQSFFYAPQSFSAGEAAFKSADAAIYGGTHTTQINNAFAGHGIGSAGGGSSYTVGSTTYSWVTTSTASGITGDDQAATFTLPFTFSFYGTNYTSINVCSNGFLNFGTSSTAYSPAAIPSTAAPNALIAGLWRDLNPTAGGTITYSSSATQFVVTWSGVKNYANTNGQTFQVILKSDGTITCQYQTVTNDVTTTIGVENSTGSAGTAYTTAPANGSAIKFTPSAAGPLLGGSQLARGGEAAPLATSLALADGARLVHGQATFAYTLAVPGHASLRVYDTAGRLVSSLADADQPAGARRVAWNGADRAITPGVYFARLQTADATRTLRFLVTR